ncbi:MAG: hypothetical protein IPK75_20175 [Acidobacteria bacterium]|nr:hypothetical protein [Acidobacteriota bacterium]
MPTLAERVQAALDEIDVCRRASVPPDGCPEWQATLIASNNAHRDRAAALERQINDIIAVLAERGRI